MTVLSLIRQLFSDPNGNGHAAIKAFQLQMERSFKTRSSMEKVTEDLKKAREAVLLKASILCKERDEEQAIREAS